MSVTRPSRGPLGLRIVDLAPITSAAALDASGRAQLEKLSLLYGDMELTAEQILAPSEEDLEEGGRIDPQYLERGRVVDGEGQHVYDVCLCMGDSGTFFLRGTTDVVADVIQFGVEGEDEAVVRELQTALEAQRSAKGTEE